MLRIIFSPRKKIVHQMRLLCIHTNKLAPFSHLPLSLLTNWTSPLGYEPPASRAKTQIWNINENIFNHFDWNGVFVNQAASYQIDGHLDVFPALSPRSLISIKLICQYFEKVVIVKTHWMVNFHISTRSNRDATLRQRQTAAWRQ